MGFFPFQRNTASTFNSWYGSRDYGLIILYLASFTAPVLRDVTIPRNVCSFTICNNSCSRTIHVLANSDLGYFWFANLSGTAKATHLS